MVLYCILSPHFTRLPQPSVNIAPVTVLSNIQCMNTPTGEYRHTELSTYTLVHLCQCVDVEIQLCNAASGNLLGLKLGLRWASGLGLGLRAKTLWHYAVPFRNTEALHAGPSHSLSHPIRAMLNSLYESSRNITLFCFRPFISCEG